MRSWTALSGALRPARGVLFLQRRGAAPDVPTEGEVREAYAALGVPVSAPFQEVKKRYVELAKQHHPDVNGGRENVASTRMVNINNAYATLSRFHKAGGVLPNSPQWPSGSGSQAYYTMHDEPYHPWHEDLNPLIYEVMWDEMRRQANSEAFADATAQEGSWRHGNNNDSHQHQQHRQQSAESLRSGQRKAHRDNNRRHTKSCNSSKTTTWPDADLQAMVNMYQDGKSFEFIANALGKQVPDVVAEFNRWSENKKRSSRPTQRRPRGYYYAESPDIDFMDFDSNDPFAYSVGEDGDYVDPEDVFFDSGAVPFRGGHYMSGPRSWRGGGGGRGRRGSGQRPW